MRDVNAGRDINVDGDFVVHDNSQQHKLLIHCTMEELFSEEPIRRQNLKEERRIKLNRFLSFIAFVAFIGFSAGVWYWFQGKVDMFSLLTGGAAFMLGLISFTNFERPTVFEQRQLLALAEINILLRERGAR